MARWRPRIHLSTALILMFAAGGLMWVNSRPPRISTAPSGEWHNTTSLGTAGPSIYMTVKIESVAFSRPGWPMDDNEGLKIMWSTPAEREEALERCRNYPRSVPYIVANLLGGAITLLAVAIAFEAFLKWRRRETR